MKSAGPGGAMAAMATPQVSAEGSGWERGEQRLGGRLSPRLLGFPVPFGVPPSMPCWRSTAPRPALRGSFTGKAPLRPSEIPPSMSPSGKHCGPAPSGSPCALWGSLCPLGVPPSIPPPGKSRVPPRREPRRGGCAEGLQPLPPARMAAPLGGGRRCGKLVGSSKNVPLRLREMGLGPSW